MQGAGGAVLRMRAALISSFTVLPEVVTTLIGKSDRAAALLIFRVRASFTNGIFSCARETRKEYQHSYPDVLHRGWWFVAKLMLSSLTTPSLYNYLIHGWKKRVKRVLFQSIYLACRHQNCSHHGQWSACNRSGFVHRSLGNHPTTEMKITF